MGYVGLPLALLLSKKNTVIGYYINFHKIKQLKKNIDDTNEVNEKTFNDAKKYSLLMIRQDLNLHYYNNIQ